jgi:glutamate synthase domain-containing protein 2
MTNANPESEAAPRPREVADYLRDMAAQLAALALGAGLKEVAHALARARDLCDAALDERR